MTLSYKNRQRDGFYDNVDSGIPGEGDIQTKEFKALDTEAALVSLHYHPSDILKHYIILISREKTMPQVLVGLI